MAKNKILIVDDDEAIRRTLKDALEAESFEVSTAADGMVGLTRALNEKPDLILTDVKMSTLDGMGMIKEIRKSDDYGKKVPIIILTNFDADEKIMKDIVESEPSFYLLKSKTNPALIVEKIKDKLGVGIKK